MHPPNPHPHPNRNRILRPQPSRLRQLLLPLLLLKPLQILLRRSLPLLPTRTVVFPFIRCSTTTTTSSPSGTVRIGVLRGHRCQSQRLQARPFHRYANNAPRVLRHEIDRWSIAKLPRNDDIPSNTIMQSRDKQDSHCLQEDGRPTSRVPTFSCPDLVTSHSTCNAAI